MKKNLILLISALLCILILLEPASAAINQIHKGNTVFIGEEGLVLNNDVFYTSGGISDTQLAYFSSGNPATDAPTYIMTPSKSSFFVSPQDFTDRQGVWYSYPNGTKNSHMAINVNYPNLGLRLYAYRAGGESFDITNGKIVSGEALDFRIDSNMYPVFSRTGVVASDDGIDVMVENQVGATLSSLYDCTGTPVSITGVHPQTSSFFLPAGSVACVWDTGNSAYKTGSYTIWAECNINNMKDNLGEIPGATITDPIGTVQNTETLSAGFTQAPTQTQTPAPAPTPAPTTPAPTPEITAEQTPAPTAPPAEETAAPEETAVQTQQTAQLPQTPLSLFPVLSALLLASVLFALRRV